MIISFKEKNNLFKKDIWNLLLILCSIAFILSSLNIFITQSTSIYYQNLIESSWETTSIWLSLFNWIPLFFAFSGFQKYLKKEKQRIRFSKYLFIGVIPLIISIFLQKLKIYGPFRYLNGFIVFYLYPVQNMGGFAGLFNNPNYAGLWLAALLPFSFALIKFYRNKKIKLTLIMLIIILVIYSILITNSRNSFLGIIIATSMMFGIKFLIISFLVLGFIYLLILGMSSVSFFGLSVFEEFMPDGLWVFNKLLQTNYLNKIQFPRIDIWQNAIKLISERPLLGWGAATFPILYLLKGGIQKAQHTHSMPLEIAQIYGIPAAFIILFFVSYLLFKAWRITFNKKNSLDSIINKAWISSALIVIVSHISDITYYDGRVSILIWILLSGLKCIVDEEKTKNNISKFI